VASGTAADWYAVRLFSAAQMSERSSEHVSCGTKSCSCSTRYRPSVQSAAPATASLTVLESRQQTPAQSSVHWPTPSDGTE
jgi:hypothetical protein